MSNNKQVNFQVKVFDLVLTVDISGALADGDVAANPAELAIASKVPAEGVLRGEITSLLLLDKDADGVALDLFLLDTGSINLGTLNAAPDLSDANAEKVFGVVPVAAADYKALGSASKVARPALGQAIPFSTASGSIFIGAVARGAVTYTAATDLRLRVGVRLFNAGF